MSVSQAIMIDTQSSDSSYDANDLNNIGIKVVTPKPIYASRTTRSDRIRIKTVLDFGIPVARIKE
jgi:hypothetical protein